MSGSVREYRACLQSRVECLGLDVLVEKFLPVFVDRGLSIAYKSDTFLHHRSDIEAVGETMYGDQPTPAHLPRRNNYLIDNLENVCFKHQQL